MQQAKHVTRHAEFHLPFIWWALRIALFAGFALGAHLAAVIGFGFPLGKAFYAYIQIHGHLQLLGWAGLFIMGISLHFVPRLAATPLEQPVRLKFVLGFMATSLVLRFIAQGALPYAQHTSLLFPLSVVVILSAALTASGILLYLTTIIQTIQRAPNQEKRPALRQVRSFFLTMLLGWAAYACLNLAMTVNMAADGLTVLAQAWDEFAVNTFISLTLLPVAFAFSVRMFPLYLRLPVIDWSVNTVAALYLAATVLFLLPTLPPVLTIDSTLPIQISHLGMIARAGVILLFIWKLDLLTRRRLPWTVVKRELHPGPDRRPTRKGLPDYGEFGRFEWLVVSSYIWLALGAGIELIQGVGFFLDWEVAISSDAVRHCFLLGFITQLILAMAGRMIPGFIGKKRLVRPDLVAATFWLVNLAAGARVFPLIAPDWIMNLPGMEILGRTAFGLSGMFAMAAIAALYFNLRKTAK